jgi:hypothetical protein
VAAVSRTCASQREFFQANIDDAFADEGALIAHERNGGGRLLPLLAALANADAVGIRWTFLDPAFWDGRHMRA